MDNIMQRSELNSEQTVHLKPKAELMEILGKKYVEDMDRAIGTVTQVFGTEIMFQFNHGNRLYRKIPMACIDALQTNIYRKAITSRIDQLLNECAAMARSAGFGHGYEAANNIYKYLKHHPDYTKKLSTL